MNKLQWQLYRMAERLGVLGLLAMGLMLGAVIVYFMVLQPLVKEFSTVGQSPLEEPMKQVQIEKTDAEILQEFLAALPSIAQRSVAVDAFMEVAAREQLEPDEVTYKAVTRLDDPVSHYQVKFRLNANYADIQHFLSELLHELNYVSIESLKFSRESVKDDEVEADIHLAFHFNQL